MWSTFLQAKGLLEDNARQRHITIGAIAKEKNSDHSDKDLSGAGI